jgi:FkbM family methyltransferase
MRFKRTLADFVEKVTGARMVRLPHGARIILSDNIPLLLEEEHLRRFFDYFKVDCVFDVGANVGQYATMIRSRADYDGPIISFEPNPQIASILREKAQQDGRWFVEEIALGASPGQAAFNIMAADEMSSLHQPQTIRTKLFETSTPIVRKIDVRVSTVEIELSKWQLELGFNRPFLKMDTQGHDVQVAVGAGDKLRQFVGLQSELAIRRFYANSPSYIEAIQFYEDRGFALSAFVPNNAGTWTWSFPYLIEMDCIMFRIDELPEESTL